MYVRLAEKNKQTKQYHANYIYTYGTLSLCIRPLVAFGGGVHRSATDDSRDQNQLLQTWEGGSP